MISFELFLLTSTDCTPEDSSLYEAAVAARELGQKDRYEELCKKLVQRRSPSMGAMYASGYGDVIAWATEGKESSKTNRNGYYKWQEPKTDSELEHLDWYDDVRYSRNWPLVWSVGICPQCSKCIGSYGKVVSSSPLSGKCPACKKQVIISFRNDVNMMPVINSNSYHLKSVQRLPLWKRFWFKK